MTFIFMEYYKITSRLNRKLNGFNKTGQIKWKYKREMALNLKIRKQPTETFVIF